VIGFAGILATMVIYLILAQNSGVPALSVAGNVTKFANAVPARSPISHASAIIHLIAKCLC
jgi:hypothetical protein